MSLPTEPSPWILSSSKTVIMEQTLRTGCGNTHSLVHDVQPVDSRMSSWTGEMGRSRGSNAMDHDSGTENRGHCDMASPPAHTWIRRPPLDKSLHQALNLAHTFALRDGDVLSCFGGVAEKNAVGHLQDS